MTASEHKRPCVSVIMANRNGAAFIGDAIKSVLEQTLQDLELIVSDDASSDGSCAYVAKIAEHDPRVRLLTRAHPLGPGGARNAALAIARGRFIAIVDSDDLMHPERLARLVAHAERDQVGIVADDMMEFESEAGFAPRRVFSGALAKAPRWIDFEDFIAANHLYANAPVLGFVKPLIAHAVLIETGVRYDESLRIGEDFDFLARLLEHDFYMRLYPELTYFYRKHAASTSHRLDRSALSALRANALGFQARARTTSERRKHRARLASIDAAISYQELVDAAKRGDVKTFALQMLRDPRGAGLLRLPIFARLTRRRARTYSAPDIAVFSHQRVVGALNGSSRYLLDICAAWARTGARVRLVQASAAVFGRWPVLALGSELDTFDRVEVAGAFKLGRLRIAQSPKVWLAAGATMLEKVLAKLRLVRPGWVAPAPSALTAPQGAEEMMFAAKHAQGARLCVADYAFLAPMFPAALNGAGPRAIIMHDLLSGRRADFAAHGANDSSATVSREHELALLSQGDVIVAIQNDEAEIVRAALPAKRVILAPLAVRTIHHPSAGDGRHLLFVASNTAANVIGLQWFFSEIWPNILRRTGGRITLSVAGSVARGLTVSAPPRVRMLGVVKDLSPLYQKAGIVISPLTLGSGLKIKLVEAMAHAKAIVATSITLQGVESLRHCVSVADEPGAFADAIARLIDHEDVRLALARASARAVARTFAPEICYAALLRLAKDAETRSWSNQDAARHAL